jgi:hypothetical protein
MCNRERTALRWDVVPLADQRRFFFARGCAAS